MMMMSLLSPSSKKERGRILGSLRLEKSVATTFGPSFLIHISNDNITSPAIDNAINYTRCLDGDVKERQLRSDDEELVLATVVLFQGFRILRYVSDRLKDDGQIMREAFEVVEKAGYPEYASARLLDDPDFITCFGIYGLTSASDRIKDDKETVLRVIRDPKLGTRMYRNCYAIWGPISERLVSDKEVGLALLNLERDSMDRLGHWTDGPDGFYSTNPLLVDPEIVTLSLAPIGPESTASDGRYWFSDLDCVDFRWDFESSMVYCYEPMRERIFGLDNKATKFGYVNCDPWERIYLVCKVAGSIAGHDDDTKDSRHKNHFNLDLRRTIIKFAGLDKCAPLTKELKRHAEVRSAMNQAGLLSDDNWTKWKSVVASYRRP